MRGVETRGGRLAVGAALSLVALLSGCGQEAVERIDGSGVRVAESYDVADFTRLAVGDAFAVEVTVGPAGPPAVTLTIDDNLLDDARIGVDDSTLEIGLRDGLTVDVDEPPRVEITVRELRAVRASGASRVDARGLDVARFDAALSGASRVDLSGPVGSLTAELSGASSLTVAEVAGGDVAVGLSGASTADLAGTAALLTLSASGASNGTADDLTADRAEVDASGASRLSVSVDVSVDARASGASEILVAGPAEISSETSGGSTVRRSAALDN